MCILSFSVILSYAALLDLEKGITMQVQEAIENRRAIKRFDPNHVMPIETEQQLLTLTQHAPTSFNIQHWRFVLAKNTELRQQIHAAAWQQAQILEASLVVIICADTQAWQKQPERYWRNLPDADTRAFMVNALTDFYNERPTLQRDEALRSVGMAAQTLMLAAQALGYDSCPMIGFDADKVAQLIQLPADHLVGMIVSIGKAAQPAWPRSGSLSYADVVIENQFPKP